VVSTGNFLNPRLATDLPAWLAPRWIGVRREIPAPRRSRGEVASRQVPEQSTAGGRADLQPPRPATPSRCCCSILHLERRPLPPTKAAKPDWGPSQQVD
jgi:hypothetical protein